MGHFNDTLIRRKNKHLNQFERAKIEVLNSLGYSAYAIAKMLKRSSNTIRNELRRGTVLQKKIGKITHMYFAETGHNNYIKNRENCGAKYKLFKCEKFIEHIYIFFYEKNHSLDSIVGASKLTTNFSIADSVCTKTLYNYVDKGLLQISNVDLPFKLRRETKNIRVRSHKRKLGTSIDLRPDIINSRVEIYTQVFKNFTADNGLEFSKLSTLELLSPVKIYFDHPYSSGERGMNVTMD